MSQVRHTFSVLSLSWSCMKGDLRTHFSKYGGVMKVQIPMDTKTGFNKGVGFVEVLGKKGFEDKVLADYHTIDRKEVRVLLRSPRQVTTATETAATSVESS